MLSETVQAKRLKTHRFLTHSIATNGATTSQLSIKAHQLNGSPGNEDEAAASDYKLVIKLSEKDLLLDSGGSSFDLY